MSCGGSGPTTSPPTTPPANDGVTVVTSPDAPAVQTVALTLSGGTVRGDVKPTVNRGATVLIVIRSDVADELHVHGYDRSVALTPGAVSRLRFTADVPGRFNGELHHAGVRALVLTVR